MKVTLSIGTADVVDALTWGMQEEIRNAMLGGIKLSGLTDKERQNLELDPTVLSKAKYKALELCVKSVTLTDGTIIPYSKEWMDGLSIADGDTLYDAVDAVTDPKKK